MRYFLELSYNGTAYNGWQRQPNATSIQEEVEHALSTILRTGVKITGAGRTDSGVHAARYIAHFDTVEEIENNADFCYHLNAILPADIAIHAAHRVTSDAHARFDALRREYKYYIERTKNPFNRQFAWYYSVDLDVDAMNRAASKLLTVREFTTFSKAHSNNKTDTCKVFHAEWMQEGSMAIFTIAADRFLRNMVRALVGTLVDVGRGKMSIEEFEDTLKCRDRSKASGSAPAEGLFMTSIEYPDEIWMK